MSLTYRLLNPQSQDIDKVKNLFLTAFAEDERPSYEVMVSLEKAAFCEVEEGNEFIGLRIDLERDDLAYLFFLAVEPNKRNLGYGGKIVDDFLADHPHQRCYLLADDPAPEYKDYPMRLRRVDFYKRHGFIPSGEKINEYGVTYIFLTHGCEVKREDHLNLMRYLLGENFKSYQYK